MYQLFFALILYLYLLIYEIVCQIKAFHFPHLCKYPTYKMYSNIRDFGPAYRQKAQYRVRDIPRAFCKRISLINWFAAKLQSFYAIFSLELDSELLMIS